MPHFKNFSLTREMFLETGAISEEDFSRAEKKAKQEKITLAEAIVRLEILSEEEVARILADMLGFPYIKLSKSGIAPDILASIPEIVAKKNRIVAFKKDSAGFHLAMADPTELEIRDFIERKEGVTVKPYLATERDIENALEAYGGELSDALSKILSLVEKASQDKKAEPPIVELVKGVISFAYKNRASDIHIEPCENLDSLVRFRIDGVLHDVSTLPRALHNQVISRLKVLARLQTDEHQKPQDGKIEFPIEKEEVDIRVSIVPITEGEKIVMRLLSERSRRFSLTNLGLAEEDLLKVQEAYRKPFGMILATGPTGCGKTTTLYTILKILNSRNVNIMTIEDPVEYDIQGVNQIQVNTKANLTFATGLRSILRQDPNIILVGEIRDKETANIAINLAMTGHLVLSTLHTNDASTAIPRFVDLGIEPFLIVSTVNVIVAQRLIRKIHDACRASEEISFVKIANYIGWEATKKAFGVSEEEAGQKTVRLYKGKGCEACYGTGYEGRIGIFEVLILDDKIKKALVKNQEAGSIAMLARANGMRTMLEDGLEKVKSGLTTLDEILGATKV